MEKERELDGQTLILKSGYGLIAVLTMVEIFIQSPLMPGGTMRMIKTTVFLALTMMTVKAEVFHILRSLLRGVSEKLQFKCWVADQ